jgi:hypothetical protein
MVSPEFRRNRGLTPVISKAKTTTNRQSNENLVQAVQ